MPLTRKKVRDGLIALLSDGTLGFNQTLASIASTYAITAYAIDWASGSNTFFQGFVSQDNERISQLAYAGEEQTSAALCLYTSSAVQDRPFTKDRTFSGLIVAHLDFYIVNRAGIESDNTENIGDATEDAVLQIMNATDIQSISPGVTWNGDYSCERDPAGLLPDGWAQRLPIQMIFEVDA